jgi:hypothetical protein
MGLYLLLWMLSAGKIMLVVSFNITVHQVIWIMQFK